MGVGTEGGEGTQRAGAVAAPTVGQRGVGWVVSVLDRGGALPVAWTGGPATEKHAGRGEWLRRLRQVRAVVPRRFFVSVLADRGLEARWVFQRLGRLGWHPGLRSKTGGTLRPAARAPSQPLRELVPTPGPQWGGTGTAFQGPCRRLKGTRLARWDDGSTAPGRVVTDVAPSASEAGW